MAWIEDVWTKVYSFKKIGSGLATWTDKYANGKFQSPTNAKEGYAISDCKNNRHRWVLKFLIPLMYPEKPTCVTVIVASTILGAPEDRVVHWGRIITAIVAKFVEHVLRSKLSPFSSNLFHLYHHKEVLNNTEVMAYDTRAEILKYGLIDEIEMGNLESKSEEELSKERQDIIERRDKRMKEVHRSGLTREVANTRGRRTQPTFDSGRDFRFF